jgi:hypothetical protein
MGYLVRPSTQKNPQPRLKISLPPARRTTGTLADSVCRSGELARAVED